jgi:hypothetical protein
MRQRALNTANKPVIANKIRWTRDGSQPRQGVIAALSHFADYVGGEGLDGIEGAVQIVAFKADHHVV